MCTTRSPVGEFDLDWLPGRRIIYSYCQLGKVYQCIQVWGKMTSTILIWSFKVETMACTNQYKQIISEILNSVRILSERLGYAVMKVLKLNYWGHPVEIGYPEDSTLVFLGSPSSFPSTFGYSSISFSRVLSEFFRAFHSSRGDVISILVVYTIPSLPSRCGGLKVGELTFCSHLLSSLDTSKISISSHSIIWIFGSNVLLRHINCRPVDFS
eukprot:TRINITY_DN6820_c0_g1_i2.p1 TRINITY_DN6820_c0_g1~~TRINITY_DN6820_c0_g1_i2.p1  ORF type:complete len:212 (+),score=26.41 TRINITY_DN6820_c0_g1_i2:449-1084(+)